MDWVGRESPVIEIGGKTLSDYRVELLQNVEKQQWSRTTANNRLNSIKSFVRWLWQIDAIPSLPRNMRGTSNALTISKPSPPIVVFERQEISTLLKQASERTKLYILLMLNCGMTQKDIADLDTSELDWELGRIRRRQSKTRKSENVPVVDYLLWSETLRLLKLARNPAETGPVLLNENGKPLWHEEITAGGKYKRKDNVRKAFDRLRKKTGINKPPKSLKKTSASFIRNNSKYASLEGLFLGHAPQSMSDKHYTVAPQTLLDEAITWLGTEYEL
jgi:integrase